MRKGIWILSVILLFLAIHIQSQKLGDHLLWYRVNAGDDVFLFDLSQNTKCEDVLSYVRSHSEFLSDMNGIFLYCYSNIEHKISIEEHERMLQTMVPASLIQHFPEIPRENLALSFFPDQVKTSLRRRCATKQIKNSALCQIEEYHSINRIVDNFLFEQINGGEKNQQIQALMLSCMLQNRALEISKKMNVDSKEEMSLGLFLNNCALEDSKKRKEFLLSQLHINNPIIGVVALEIMRWNISEGLETIHQLSSQLPPGFDKWCVDLARKKLEESR